MSAGGILIKTFYEYILNHFDQYDLSFENLVIFSTYHLRFELGHGLENGTKERVDQSTVRATLLFEEFFEQTDDIWVFINSCNCSTGNDFWNPTNGYLEAQFQDYETISKCVVKETIEDIVKYL